MTEQTAIRIGAWVLQPALNRIRRGESTVTLEPLAAQVLEYLASHPRQVVSPDELIEHLWGRRMVGDSPVYRIIAELRRALGDDARQPQYIETIRKRGYRLVAAVEKIEPPGAVDAARAAANAAPSALPDAARPRGSGRAIAAAALGAAIGALALVWMLWPASAPPTPDARAARPVVAVMPFENLSSADEDYLVRGLSDAIATRLAGVDALRVIAQNSTRQFDDSRASSAAIGEQLGAAYLVTGSALRRTDGAEPSIRINAHLVEVATDSYVWSQTYELPVSDIIDLQGRIAESVAQQLDVTVLEPERVGLLQQATLSPDVYDHYLRGKAALARGWLQEDLEEAVQALEAATALDGGFAAAFAALGIAHLELYAQYWDRSEERLELARTMIDRALEIDAGLTDGHYGLGNYYLRRNMLDAALQHLSIVRQAQPSNTAALLGIAQVHQRRGEMAQAVNLLDAAVSLDPLNHRLLYLLGQTRIVAGDYARAEPALERAVTLRPELFEGYLFKAVLYMSWRGDEQRAAAEFRRAADRLGMEAVMQTLLQPGLSSAFRFAGPEFRAAVRDWQLEGSAADPAAYHLAMAEVAEIDDDEAAAREHYDRARRLLEETVREMPDEPFFYAMLGSAYAGAGMREEALAAGRRLLELAPVADNVWDNADFLWYMAEIYVQTGLYDEAIDQVEAALQYPTTLSRTWIAVEPFWAPLRGDPRFQALIAHGG